MGALHRIGPVVPLLVGAAGMVGAYQLSLGPLDRPGPGMWPFIVATVITVTAFILLFTDIAEDYESFDRASVRVVLGLVGLAVFIVAFQALGLLLPGTLMLLLWLRLFAREPWRLAVPLAVLGAGGLYLLFDQVLGVPFPDDAVLTVFGLG